MLLARCDLILAKAVSIAAISWCMRSLVLVSGGFSDDVSAAIVLFNALKAGLKLLARHLKAVVLLEVAFAWCTL